MVKKKATATPALLKNLILVGFVAVVVLAAWWFMRSSNNNPPFDGGSALALVQTQVDFGPRIPGSEGHQAMLAWMTAELEQHADAVNTQPFTYTDAQDSTLVWEGTNVVASFNLNPEGGRRIMLSAHWDTRPHADQDPDPTRRSEPVLGANDGGSGVAVLMEMAKVLAANEPSVGVDLIFFDMEDIGDDVGPEPDSAVVSNPFAIGSQQFVEANPTYRPQFGILLDMVCDANLRIPKETYSTTHAGSVVDLVWEAADRVGASAFLDEPGGPVADDHVAFLQQGIPVIDLIHYPFPSTWHTVNDLPESCSAESLQQIGDVVIEVVYNQ